MTEQNYILQKTSLFQGIPDGELSEVLECLQVRQQRYQKEEILLYAGDTASEFGILLEGRIQVLREEYDGQRSIVADVMPGELFAEAFACASKERDKILLVTVQSMAASLVLWIHARRLAASCAYHSRLTENMLGILAVKNILLNRKIGHLSKRSTREKLLSYFTEQAMLQGSNRIAVPFSQQELADYLCVERSGLSAVLNDLRRAGILQYTRGQFELRAPRKGQNDL